MEFYGELAGYSRWGLWGVDWIQQVEFYGELAGYMRQVFMRSWLDTAGEFLWGVGWIKQVDFYGELAGYRW